MICARPFNIWLVVLNSFMVMPFPPLPLLKVFASLFHQSEKRTRCPGNCIHRLFFSLCNSFPCYPNHYFLGSPKLQDTLFLKTNSSSSFLTLGLLPNLGLKPAHLACGNKHFKCTMTLEFLPGAKNCVPDLRHLHWYAQWRHSDICHASQTFANQYLNSLFHFSNPSTFPNIDSSLLWMACTQNVTQMLCVTNKATRTLWDYDRTNDSIIQTFGSEQSSAVTLWDYERTNDSVIQTFGSERRV